MSRRIDIDILITVRAWRRHLTILLYHGLNWQMQRSDVTMVRPGGHLCAREFHVTDEQFPLLLWRISNDNMYVQVTIYFLYCVIVGNSGTVVLLIGRYYYSCVCVITCVAMCYITWFVSHMCNDKVVEHVEISAVISSRIGARVAITVIELYTEATTVATRYSPIPSTG